MAYGTTLNSSPVLTDDNQPWPEDQPPPSSSYANVGPQPQQSPYYLVNLAKSLWSGATLPGDVATGKASMTDPATQARVQDMTGLQTGSGLTQPAEEDALNAGFRLYHGSKVKFDQPSTDFIGTGQGAQTYGWGIYGAQAEPVALDLRNQVSGQALGIGDRKVIPSGAPEEQAMSWLRSGHIQGVLDPFDYARENIARSGKDFGMNDSDIQKSADALAAWKRAGAKPVSAGHMQEWEVNADPEHFLDWDALADEQTPHVARALQNAPWGDELQRHLDTSSQYDYTNPAGQNIYDWLSEDLGPKGASHALVDAGIPGIRHLDAVSRGGAARQFGVPSSDATRNFILPDPSLIKVVRHYNAAGAPATFGNVFNDKPGQTP